MWGTALARLKPAVAESVWARWQASVRRADANHCLGTMFEIFAAALFQDATHPVLSPNDRQPGFDFGLDVGSGNRVHVSVKNLLPSQHETNMRVFAEALRADLKARLPLGVRLSIRAFARGSATPQFLDSERHALVSAIIGAITVQARRVRDVGPWSVLLDPLKPFDGNVFADGAASFTAVVAMEHAPNENQRVASNSIEVACEKFRRHAATGAGVANVFFIKIPTSVDVEEARQAVRDALARPTNSAISGGYLYRASWLTDDSGLNFYVGHEIYEDKNMAADVSLDRVCPKISLPIPFGRVQTVVPRWELHVGDEVHVVDGEHAVVVGSHTYQGAPRSSVARHGIELLWERGGRREVLFEGHDDRLVLL